MGRGSLLLQGVGGDGEVHLALPGGRQGKIVRAFLMCTMQAIACPSICFQLVSQPMQLGTVKPHQKGRLMLCDGLISVLQALFFTFSGSL